MADLYEILGELVGYEVVAWAVESNEKGARVCIIPGDRDDVWGHINRLRLPWFPSADAEGDEEEEIERWLEGFRRTKDGYVSTPYQVVRMMDDEDVDPLYPLAAALLLAGGVTCEEGPDESLFE